MTRLNPYYQQDGITIYCGDSMQILMGLSLSDVGIILTDPPYSSGGAMRGDRTNNVVSKYVQTETAKNFPDIPDFHGDTRDQLGYQWWLSLVMNVCWHAASPNALFGVFTDWRQLPATTNAVQAGNWVWRGIAVWDKTGAARPTKGRFASQAEYVVWGSKGATGEQHADTLPGVFKYPPLAFGRDDKEHIAQKPIGLMRELLKFAADDSLILDPFMGSGTTLRAAKDMGRRAIGIEMSPEYCEIAVRRLAQSVMALEVPV